MPTVAVELDVGDAALARHLLLRVRRGDVAHLRDVGVPEQRVVVDRDLRVERRDARRPGVTMSGLTSTSIASVSTEAA